ncbi:MAG: hypothetical protein LC799_01100 [Actinobacteria bacterium]|nr:hypothetical protein [Actinomycetota bacterium]
MHNTPQANLFAASYLARRRDKRTQDVALSVIGMGVLTARGFLGGTCPTGGA